MLKNKQPSNGNSMAKLTIFKTSKNNQQRNFSLFIGYFQESKLRGYYERKTNK